MQNKNTNTSRRFSRRAYGIGVFLAVVILLWFLSFKLFGPNIGVNFTETRSFGSDNGLSGGLGPVFSDASDYPVMITFDNHPDSQAYLTGLSGALVVYEFLAEGGSTRFAAVYSGSPSLDKIGPIRSARPYVVEIGSGWSAFFWHAGGSPEALDLIRSGKTDIIDLNEISGLGIRYFWRDRDIPRPHNLFTSGDLIALGLDDFELIDLPHEKLLWQWQSSEEELDEQTGEPAGSVYVDFSEGIAFDPSYEYDEERKEYLRFMGGVAHKDASDGEQMRAANIIVQRIPYEGYYPSGLGRISLGMTGAGEMILFQRGRAIKGTWKKDSQNSQTEWLDDEGSPIILARSQTWVEILPGARSLSWE